MMCWKTSLACSAGDERAEMPSEKRCSSKATRSTPARRRRSGSSHTCCGCTAALPQLAAHAGAAAAAAVAAPDPSEACLRSARTESPSRLPSSGFSSNSWLSSAASIMAISLRRHVQQQQAGVSGGGTAPGRRWVWSCAATGGGASPGRRPGRWWRRPWAPPWHALLRPACIAVMHSAARSHGCNLAGGVGACTHQPPSPNGQRQRCASRLEKALAVKVALTLWCPPARMDVECQWLAGGTAAQWSAGSGSPRWMPPVLCPPACHAMHG